MYIVFFTFLLFGNFLYRIFLIIKPQRMQSNTKSLRGAECSSMIVTGDIFRKNRLYLVVLIAITLYLVMSLKLNWRVLSAYLDCKVTFSSQMNAITFTLKFYAINVKVSKWKLVISKFIRESFKEKCFRQRIRVWFFVSLCKPRCTEESSLN